MLFTQICLVWVLAVVSTFAQDSSPKAPTQPNIDKSCNKFYTVPTTGDCLCDCVEKKFSITSAQFLKWNPDVSSDCTKNFWGGYAYCVGVGTTTTKPSTTTKSSTTTKPPTTTKATTTKATTTKATTTKATTGGADPTPGAPTQPNIAKDCNAFFTIPGSGDCLCDCVEKKFNITAANFFKWNPDVSSDCAKNFWSGYAYCVGVGPSKVTTTKVTTTSKTTTWISTPYSIKNPITSWNISTPTVETTFPPKKTQAGQSSSCVDWRLINPGDTCDSIVASLNWMSKADFHAANPALGAQCENLLNGYWVCTRLKPGPASFSYDWTTGTANGTASVPNPTKYTPTTWPTANSSFVASPTAGAIAKDCKAYYQAQSNDSCLNVPQIESGLITQQQFFSWNPPLNGSCGGMWANYYYCAIAGNNPSAPSATSRPAAIPSGQIATCAKWYKASGYEDCSDISSFFGTFSTSDFIKWNPSVGSACTNIVANKNYCVGIPGTPTTRTNSPTTPSAPPTQTGIPSSCKKYWLVSSGDTCDSIAASNGISKDNFLKWNPAVGSTCSGLSPDTYVCVAA